MMILSVTVAGSLGCPFNLNDISKSFSFTSKSKRLNCVRVYLSGLHDDTATLQFFEKGRVVCTANSETLARKALRRALKTLSLNLKDDAEVVNVFGSGDLGFPIDLETVQVRLKNATFDLTSHHSVLRVKTPLAFVSFFRSGRFQAVTSNNANMQAVPLLLKDFAQQIPEWSVLLD
jgi:TATA-box binding protein (TBP) (component of TFIID and TFIIIB)